MVHGLVEGLQILEHELLLFAAFWFIVAACDELLVDGAWLWLRSTGRARDGRIPRGYELRPLVGQAAVMVPAWHEADVIGEMIAHTLGAWSQRALTLYVGCYCNDADTLASAMRAAGGDPRIRLVIHDRRGPTTKADCLNRLYAAMLADERRLGLRHTGVVLHDAEDMVHPAALAVIDRMLERYDFVQLPVRPEPQRSSNWVAGHYSDEFAEAHGKTLVVRAALGAAIPAAGVGCGFSRRALAEVAARRALEGSAGPFSNESLTEDYELGLTISRRGERSCFLRLRDADGELVATRAFFPATLEAAVRQKTRWIHGIALQGWDRIGWIGRPVDLWMALRDRRGPLAAIVIAAAYGLFLVEAALLAARPWLPLVRVHDGAGHGALIDIMISASFVAFVWRAIWRFGFTAREYGVVEGLRGILRIPVANIIAMMAGRRALTAYLRTLGGAAVSWDKTRHDRHPAAMAAPVGAARAGRVLAR